MYICISSRPASCLSMPYPSTYRQHNVVAATKKTADSP